MQAAVRMPALHSISFDPPSALGSLVLLSSEECLRACRATRDCATFAVMLHSPCRMPCRLFSSNASARGTSGSAAGDAKMHIRGPHAKRLTETVRNIASRRRREVIRAAARTAEKPRICWEALPAQTLLVHSQQPRRDRCAFRRRTWREAVSLCLTTPWCGGLTRDHGMHCGEEMRLLRYELRLGVVEAMSPRLVQRLVRGVPANKWMVDMLTVSWLIRSAPCGRNRTNASLNGHQWAPPRDHELNTSYRSSSHDALTADQRRKAYLQSHWHPGMEEVDSCLRMRRLGNAGDGGKMVCFDEGIRPDARSDGRHDLQGGTSPSRQGGCRVVSVGTGDDFSFEEAMLRRVPQCAIDVFDGTNFARGQPPTVPAQLRFHWENFNRTSWVRFQYTSVDILKMDCEGCEYSGVHRCYPLAAPNSPVPAGSDGCLERALRA